MDHSGTSGEIVAGHYRLLTPLGAGAMGSVWRALDVSSGREVALKYIHPELTSHPAIVERFRREMAITARIHSPYTVEVLEVGAASDGRQYLAMELVGGRSLAATIAEDGAIPPTRIVRIGAQVAEALSAAHAVGVIHRDLKPDNIMLYERTLGSGPHMERDRVKVLDFGVARLVDNSPVDGEDNWQTLTRQGALVGTPRYMSPEQISFEPVTTRTDLYALGVVLYEMAVGRPPFPCNSVREALNEHLFEEPVPPSQALGQPFPPALERLILSLLAKDPVDRPQTAGAVAAALNDALVNTAPAPDPKESAPKAEPRSSLTLVPDLPGPSAGTLVPDVGGTLIPDVGGTLIPDGPPARAVQSSSLTMVPEADMLDEMLRDFDEEPKPTPRETALRDFDALMSARSPLAAKLPGLAELGDEPEPTELVDRGMAHRLAELGSEDAATQLADEEISRAIQASVLDIERPARPAPPVAPAAPVAAPAPTPWWRHPRAPVVGLALAFGLLVLVLLAGVI